MPSLPRSLRILALGAVAAVAAACATPFTAGPASTVCHEVSSDAGGCTIEQHTFTGATCAELGQEWASFVDRLVLKIIDGPDSVRGEGKSVRLKQAVVITTIDMNHRLRALDLQAECSEEDVMRVADGIFSSKLKSGVGGAIWDGDPVSTYEDWLTDVRRSVRMIDLEE